MEKIATPESRAYFQASRNEPDRIICWIPAEEYRALVQDAGMRGELRQFYPDGIEVELTNDGFEELGRFGIELALTPRELRETYEQLRGEEALPQDGVVGAELEEQGVSRRGGGRRGGARGPAAAARTKLRPPRMKAGKNPLSFMSRRR